MIKGKRYTEIIKNTEPQEAENMLIQVIQDVRHDAQTKLRLAELEQIRKEWDVINQAISAGIPHDIIRSLIAKMK